MKKELVGTADKVANPHADPDAGAKPDIGHAVSHPHPLMRLAGISTRSQSDGVFEASQRRVAAWHLPAAGLDDCARADALGLNAR